MEIVIDICVPSDWSILYNIITDTKYENVPITSLFDTDLCAEALSSI